MLYVLLITLLIGLFIAYRLTNRNILSPWVIAHLMYIFSTLILVLNYDIVIDISVDTVAVIIVSLLSFGIGEIFVRHTLFSQHSKLHYAQSNEIRPITISKKAYIFSLVSIALYAYISYSNFNLIGSYLGGGNFITKYALVRKSIVDASNGIEPIVEARSYGILNYLGFFVEVLVYAFVFVLIYNKFYKIKTAPPLLFYIIPVLLYLPSCVLSTTRSIFIKLLAVIGIMLFFVYKQSNHGWGNANNNKKIIRIGIVLVLVFFALFSSVGRLKEQDVTEDISGMVCGYAGASIIGLDTYLGGRFERQSEYPGQVTLEGIYTLLNKIGFDYPPPAYHQEDFVWGKQGQTSNIFSAPFYVLIDFPFIALLFIYFFWGSILGYFMNVIKFGKARIYNYGYYILIGMLYYPVIMISITDAFRHLIGTAFLLSLISIYFLKYIFKIEKTA